MPSPRTLSESEFNAIKERVLSSMPNNLTEDEFNRAVGPRLEAALGEAENAPPSVEGSAVGRFLSNAGEMLNPISMVQGTYNAVRHPLDTVTGVVGAMGDQWSKAADAARAGNYTEAAARAVTGSVPVVGPLVAGIGEQAGTGDFAGAAGKMAGLAVPFAAEEALGARAAGQAGKAGQVEREAVQQVAGRVLAPGNPRYKGIAQSIAPEVLARKLSGNRLQLQEAAEEGMLDAGVRLDQAIQDAGGTAAKVPTMDVVARLRSNIADLQDSNGKPLSGQAAARIQAIQDRVNQIQSLGGRSRLVSFEDLRKIRDENYGIAADAKAYERMGNPVKSDEGWAAKQTGSAIREAFATRSPAQAAANADYTFWKNLNDVLDPVKGRPKSLAPSAGITGGARTTGAVVGMLTGSKPVAFVLSTVVPWLQERMADSSWQLADASRKMKLAQAMKAGDVGTMQSLMVKWAEGAPRSTSPSESQTPAGLTPETP